MFHTLSYRFQNKKFPTLMLDPSDISDYSFGHEQKYHDRRRAACLDRRLRHSAQLAADDLWETDAWGCKPHFRLTRWRSEEHTSELQSLMRISYAVLCLNKNKY